MTWWSEPERIPPALVRLLLDRAQLRTLGIAAVWADAPLDELDPQPRRNRAALLEEGAELVVRRGGSRCFECGAKLRSSTRQTRTDYCSRHRVSEARVRSRENAIREALDAASGQRRRRRDRKRRRTLG